MALKDIIGRTYSAWMSTNAPHTDVALSSRIRLARNLGDIPFPWYASSPDLAKVAGEVEKAVKSRGWRAGNRALQRLQRQILAEKHLISPQHAKEGENRLAIIAADESISVMVNEEDHLRIQTLLPGLQLTEAYELADNIDDLFETKLNYAFDERIGYITACPTNVGTGLRASIMVHLPALAIAGQAKTVLSTVSNLGIAVRGLYGEGTEASGNMFQLSNQVSLGRSEHELIDNLCAVTMQIIEQERATRKKLLYEMRMKLEDRVQRAYGILRHARLITSQEALRLLSDVKLGVEMRLISEVCGETLNELMVITQPAYLQKLAGEELNPTQRDIRRAELIRERLSAK